MDDFRELKVKRRFYSQVMEIYRRSGLYLPFFQTLVRTGLRLKVAKDRVKIDIFSRRRGGEIRDWFEKTRIFFGFAIFRSGTAFLATFLNQIAPDAVIEHEANVDDYWYYFLALRSEAEAEKYIRDFRLAEIYYRMRNRPEGLYGEINPYLRRHCKALKRQLPRARLFHLVRDGKKVVRSLMSREIMAKNDPLRPLAQPPPDDPYVNQWQAMSRFEKICWLWQSDNKYMRETTGLTLQFETLIRDYDYFRAKLTDPIGIDVSRAAWEENTRLIGNPTPAFRMDSWSRWSDSERDVFRAICGKEMEACGYDFQ